MENRSIRLSFFISQWLPFFSLLYCLVSKTKRKNSIVLTRAVTCVLKLSSQFFKFKIRFGTKLTCAKLKHVLLCSRKMKGLLVKYLIRIAYFRVGLCLSIKGRLNVQPFRRKWVKFACDITCEWNLSFIWKDEHQDWLWGRGWKQLAYGQCNVLLKWFYC